MTSDDAPTILTVSTLNGIARRVLEAELNDVWVEGELGNVSRPASGHIYFTLKDESAQIRCAMFRSRRRFLHFEPDVGLRVQIRGNVSLYEARGDYQLIVEQMKPAGEGALQLAFERLKRKLFEAGLFDEAQKKPLPPLPARIGIVTSPSGAAIRDVLQILKRRFPLIEVIVYPVPVQGDEAASQIASAIELANERAGTDLLIVTRGGGSLEDLWPFNDERVARAIHGSQLPVVSAVGHEIDTTIADFVADVRAPTPSAAAELVSPDRDALATHLESLAQRLSSRMLSRTADLGQYLSALSRRLDQQRPTTRLMQWAQRLDELERRLTRIVSRRLEHDRTHCSTLAKRLSNQPPSTLIETARSRLSSLHRRLKHRITEKLDRERQRLETLRGALNHLGPDQVLKRGYVIVSSAESGTLHSHADSPKTGESVRLRFQDGERHASITD